MGRGFVDGRRIRLAALGLDDRTGGKARALELLGLCEGIVADGEVNEREFEYLIGWFERHQDAFDRWPANVVLNRLAAIVEDDFVEPHELEDLAELLRDLGRQEQHPDLGLRVSAHHVVTHPAPHVFFPNRNFVFTGEFLCDSRRGCEQAVLDRGGSVKTSVSAKTDYVIIGTIAAPEWAHGNYGTKVAKALEYCQRGHPIAIVAEEQWARYL